MCFLFFKQKTAYEMRISDWSSDVALPICFHGTFGAGSDLDAAVRRRNRSGAEDIEGLRLVGTERHDAAAGKEVVADAPGGDGAGVGVVAAEAGDAAEEGRNRVATDRKSTRPNSSH